MKKTLLLAFLLFSTSATAADLNTGLQALKAGDYTTALRELQPLALDGNAEAEYRMCGMYYLAQGVPKNDTEAANFCHASAERGNADAMYNLGLFYQKGEGVRQDFNEATKWYAAAASKGQTDAKFNLTQIQTAINASNKPKSIDVVHNTPSNLLAQVAPAAGNTSAHAAATAAPVVNMSTAEMGAGAAATVPNYVAPAAPTQLTPPPMPPEPPEPKQEAQIIGSAKTAAISPDIAKYCLMAAQRGNPDPKCEKEFAPLLTEDNSVTYQQPHIASKPAKTATKPKAQLAKAAPQAPAQPVEPAKPAGLLNSNQVASEGAVLASNQAAAAPALSTPTSSLVTNSPSLAIVSAAPAAGNPPSTTQNLQWYIDQANTGNAQAQNNLGVMYRRGINGTQVNTKESLKWFERAASQGSTNAMLNLGSIYKNGEGTQQNLQLAYAWYNLASGRLPVNSPKRSRAQENVQQISQYLNNQQIGDALQYVSKLEDSIPVMNETNVPDDD